MSKRCREYGRGSSRHAPARAVRSRSRRPCRKLRAAEGLRCLRCPSLRLQPSRDRRDHMLLFGDRERSPRFNHMPLRQTPAAARGRSVLRDEHRVSSKWSLLAIVARRYGCEPLGDEVSRVDEHCHISLRGEVLAFFRPKREPTAEARPRQRGKEGIEISHEESARGARSFRARSFRMGG